MNYKRRYYMFNPVVDGDELEGELFTQLNSEIRIEKERFYVSNKGRIFDTELKICVVDDYITSGYVYVDSRINKKGVALLNNYDIERKYFNGYKNLNIDLLRTIYVLKTNGYRPIDIYEYINQSSDNTVEYYRIWSIIRYKCFDQMFISKDNYDIPKELVSSVLIDCDLYEDEEIKNICHPNIKQGNYGITNYGRVLNLKTNKFISSYSYESRNYRPCVTLSGERDGVVIRLLFTINGLMSRYFMIKTKEDILYNRNTVCHIDGDVCNTYFMNLRYITASERRSGLSEKDAINIYKLYYNDHMKVKSIYELYADRCSCKLIYNIVNGRSYKEVIDHVFLNNRKEVL